MTKIPAACRYVTEQSYAWNYERAPQSHEMPLPELVSVPGNWTYCGRPVDSPLSVAAGPLLNGAWCEYYARLGFDVVTYKTVRSKPRECYPAPNLAYVDAEEMTGRESEIEEVLKPRSSWAVSFGMPSKAPAVWQQDVTATRAALQSLAGRGMPGRRPPLLAVSVVATVDAGATLEELAADYATCAKMARDAGADIVEANFSCPNVSTCDGQLYQQPEAAAVVARQLRDAVGDMSLIVKIGHFLDLRIGCRLMETLGPLVGAVAMTNSVAARVRSADGSLLFDGQMRGICGEACRAASLRQVERMSEHVQRNALPLRIIGVGGIFEARHVRQYLDAGAEAVQMATAVMQQPRIALGIRQQGIPAV